MKTKHYLYERWVEGDQLITLRACDEVRADRAEGAMVTSNATCPECHQTVEFALAANQLQTRAYNVLMGGWHEKRLKNKKEVCAELKKLGYKDFMASRRNLGKKTMIEILDWLELKHEEDHRYRCPECGHMGQYPDFRILFDENGLLTEPEDFINLKKKS